MTARLVAFEGNLRNRYYFEVELFADYAEQRKRSEPEPDIEVDSLQVLAFAMSVYAGEARWPAVPPCLLFGLRRRPRVCRLYLLR